MYLHHSTSRPSYTVCACDYCGAQFERPQSLTRNSNFHYCNAACRWKGVGERHRGKNNPMYNSFVGSCDYCGKTVIQPMSNASPNTHHFCNPRCRQAWMKGSWTAEANPRYSGGPVTVVCEVCGTPFERIPAKVERSKHQYCSAACMGKACRKDPRTQPTYETLYDLYVVQQLNFTSVGNKIGCSSWVTKRLLTEHGIPLRDRGEWGKINWKKASPERRVKQREQLIAWNKAHPDLLRRFAYKAWVESQRKKGATSIEQKIADALDNAAIPYVFQYGVGGKFLCDFAFPEHMLIVECDGLYWHSRPEAKRRDRSKDAYLRECGYTVLRFTDKRINSDLDGCIREITAHLS